MSSLTRRRGFLGKAIRFLLRLGARAVGAILLFIVLGALAVYLTLRGMMDSDNTKSFIVAHLQEVFHRPVQIDSVVLTPRGIKLNNLRIIERIEMPGHTMIDSDFVLITVRPWPLLRGQVRLKSVLLVSPRISIVRSEAGEWSVADILSSTRPAASVGGFSLWSLAADLTRIEEGVLRIDDRLGRRKYVIERFSLAVDEFDARKPFDFEVSFDNVNTVGGRAIATSWDAHGMASLASWEWSEAKLRTSKFVLSVDGLRAEGSVGIKNFREPELDVKLSLPEVGRAHWLKYAARAPDLILPPSQWQASVSVSSGQAVVSGLKVKAGPLSASGELSVRFGEGVAASSGPSPSPAFAVSGDVALDPFPLDAASRFTGLLEPFRLEGRLGGRVKFSARPGSLQIDRFDAHWKGGRGRYRDAGFRGDFDFSAVSDRAGRKPGEEPWQKVELGVEEGALSASSQDVSDVGLTASLAGGGAADRLLASLRGSPGAWTRAAGRTLKVDLRRFSWGGAAGKAKALVRDDGKAGKILLDGSLSLLDWGRAQSLLDSLSPAVSTAAAAAPAVSTGAARGGRPAAKPKEGWVAELKKRHMNRLLESWQGFVGTVKDARSPAARDLPDTMGHLAIDEIRHSNFRTRKFDILWELRGLSPDLKKFKGEAKLAFGPGRVEDIESVSRSSKFMDVVFMSYVLMYKMNKLSVLSAATAYPKNLDFDVIRGEYGFEQGNVATKYFYVQGPQLVAFCRGSMDFNKESIEQVIKTRLSSYRGLLPEWWQDEKGRPAIGFDVKGNLNAPSLDPHMTKMKANEIEDLRDEALGRSERDFKVEEKLKELL